MSDHDIPDLENLLERHRDATLIERHRGRHAVVRRDQVLAAPEDADAVDEDLRRWARSREDGGDVTRFHLRPQARVDVGELVSELQGARGPTASPNHLLSGQPWWFGPAGEPEPAPDMPAPRAEAVERPVTVAVLDTGLSPHPWFRDKDWYETQRGEGIAEVLDADHDHRLDDQAGHGTFIAGVVLQRAPSARMVIRRVLGRDGVCDEFELIPTLRAVRLRRDAAGRRVDLVNLSLGCYTFDDRPTPVMRRAIDTFDDGAVVVACAGNAAGRRPFWPAALDRVVSVGALNGAGESRAGFSNYGPWVDACAVGEDVHSSFVVFDGPRRGPDGQDPDRFTGYAKWSGTSFATPHVTGTIAARSAARGRPVRDVVTDLLADDGRTLPGLGTVVA